MNVIPDETPRPRGPDDFPSAGPNSLASIGQRAAARLLDTVLIGVPAVLVLLPFVTVEGNKVTSIPGWAILPFVAMMVVYEVALETWLGQTLGKMLLGVRVARLVNGTGPDVSQVTLRALLPASVLAIPFISVAYPFIYLTAGFSPMRRGVHDHAGGTVVVRTR
jgi:uncharacterized RDD family membrane protein YckC